MSPLPQVWKIIHLCLSVRNVKLWLRNMTSAVNYRCSPKWLLVTLNQVADVFEIMTDAAKIEPDFERIVQKLNKQRLEHMTFAVQQIAANGPFRENMDEAYARDTVWTLTSGEVFLLLTRDRGWSKEQYAEWLADMLIRALLP